MTPKEKAKELVGRFNEHIEYDTNFKDETIKAKKRALICVDEFIDALSFNSSPTAEGLTEFYEEVKQEINKL
tara:strand:+ start:73 stop:288 length:216 start_codon:yes stop_codon:yes gene_type:complete